MLPDQQTPSPPLFFSNTYGGSCSCGARLSQAHGPPCQPAPFFKCGDPPGS